MGLVRDWSVAKCFFNRSVVCGWLGGPHFGRKSNRSVNCLLFVGERLFHQSVLIGLRLWGLQPKEDLLSLSILSSFLVRTQETNN